MRSMTCDRCGVTADPLQLCDPRKLNKLFRSQRLKLCELCERDAVAILSIQNEIRELPDLREPQDRFTLSRTG